MHICARAALARSRQQCTLTRQQTTALVLVGIASVAFFSVFGLLPNALACLQVVLAREVNAPAVKTKGFLSSRVC